MPVFLKTEKQHGMRMDKACIVSPNCAAKIGHSLVEWQFNHFTKHVQWGLPHVLWDQDLAKRSKKRSEPTWDLLRETRPETWNLIKPSGIGKSILSVLYTAQRMPADLAEVIALGGVLKHRYCGDTDVTLKALLESISEVVYGSRRGRDKYISEICAAMGYESWRNPMINSLVGCCHGHRESFGILSGNCFPKLGDKGRTLIVVVLNMIAATRPFDVELGRRSLLSLMIPAEELATYESQNYVLAALKLDIVTPRKCIRSEAYEDYVNDILEKLFNFAVSKTS